MKSIRVFEIISRRRMLIFGLIFVLVAGSLTWFGWNKLTKRIKAGITVSVDGQTVTFGSGYYGVDSFGKVYTKVGSPIANTADAMYPFVSYLSSAYILPGGQLDLTGKDVIVASGATVLMEGTLSFNSLDVQTGGLISQPQPDREGYINRYQYSDQEWGLIFYGFLKVNNGDTAKLVCPSDYYTDPSTNRGNGCSTSYSPTYDGSASIYDLANWVSMDQVWQTASGAFNVARYTDPGSNYINNTTGADRYYPIRLKFKNDNRDNRLEPMQVILRNSANALVGSVNGVDDTLIYGVTAGGTYDTAGHMDISYHLADQYLPTMASPNLGWILEDFTGTYESYSAKNIELTTFFDGYGEKTNGVFNLEFDDRTAYDGTVASTPFAKGTSGAVYDPEVYKTYTSSAKVINTQMLKGPASRYIPAGLTLDVGNGEVKLSGGYIDVSGKGYAGYNMELRSENDDASLLAVRGGGYTGPPAVDSGGLSSNNIPQSAAHAGNGGGGRDKNGVDIAANSNVYDTKTVASTLGSGAGGASQAAAVPSHGGNGGGYVFVRAKVLRFTTKTTGIKANGDNGYQIASGWLGSGGGSGGTVAVAAATVYYPTTDANTFYFQASGGVGFQPNGATFYSSGGGGGYVRLAFSSFYYNGLVTTSKDKVRNSLKVIGGQSGTDPKLYGIFGQFWIDFSPVVDMSFPKADKTVTITRAAGESGAAGYQVLPDDTVNVNLDIHGLADLTTRLPVAADIVLVSDTTGSMSATVGGHAEIWWLQQAAKSLLDSAVSKNNEFPTIADRERDGIKLGLVNFNGTHGTYNPDAPGDFGGCEANENNPEGIVCSNSYLGNYMTTDPTVFAGAYKAAVDSYIAFGGTSAGSGLNNAIDHLLNGPDARSWANKYIIFVTDGKENLPTCITGPVDSDRKTPACDSSVDRFESSASGPAIAGYPLDRIHSNQIELISINTSSTIGTASAEETLQYSNFLRHISEYARQPYFKDQVYYDVTDINKLNNDFQNSFDSIVNASLGTRIEIQETLPPGTELVGDLPPITILGDASVNIIPTKTVDSSGRITLIWSISPLDYLPEVDFGSQHFLTTIHYRSGNVPSGEFFDSDQNRLCLGDTPGDIDELNSFANYQPAGNYTVAASSPEPNPVPFDSFCHQYFSNTIRGDVYGLKNVLPLFAQIGRHLYQSGEAIGSDSTAFYKMSGYQFNPYAQAYWGNDPGNRNATMTATIIRLKLNAKKLTWDPLSGIFDGICAPVTGCPESAQYPEGRVWLTVNNVNINTALQYQKKSTIIIDGGLSKKNLVIDASIIPFNSDPNYSIGFIVRNGDVTISNASGNPRKINASMFVPNGNIIISGSKIELYGSFVTKDFQVNLSSTNIKFLEDTRGESLWPPGFREMRSISTTNN